MRGMTRRIDAYSLRLFVSTARAGSIVRGAALEHIAPSSLSRRIADPGRSLHERVRALQKPFAPTVSVSSFDAVRRMVEAGLGIAVIPQSAASAYAGSPRFRAPAARRNLGCQGLTMLDTGSRC
jgi:DNA-binding transcriptional LysR family regulator